MKKWFDFVFIPLFILNVAIFSLTIYSRSINVLPYKDCSITSVEYNICDDGITTEQIKKDVDGLFGNPFYILNYTDLDAGIAGRTLLLINLITLDEGLSLEQYTLTLTHELVHLTHFTTNERYTSFTTFKVLYESKNDYFKNVALKYADCQVKHRYPMEYDCSGYIEEYLFK